MRDVQTIQQELSALYESRHTVATKGVRKSARGISIERVSLTDLNVTIKSIEAELVQAQAQTGAGGGAGRGVLGVAVKAVF